MAKFMVQCSWNQCPHLDPETIADMLASLPPHQRDARSAGIPALGSGAIYPIAESEFVVQPFDIPKTWRRCYAMDVGWNRCLAKDSMVMIPDGTERPIQDLKVGDEVLAFDFESESLVPTKVVDTFVGFAKNMVTVGISDYQTITCTDDHPFAHRATPKDKIKFKKVREINERIREFQSVVLPSKWTPEIENNVCSPEMARVIGYLLGDGCLTYINRRLEFAQKIPEFIDDMRKCLESVECVMASYANNSTHHLSGKTNGKNAVLDFVRDHGLLGTNSSTKFIPPVFLTATEDIIKNLLVGLIHTDGTVEGDHVRYYTVSKDLADGVKKLCLRLGIYASISIDKRKRQLTHNDVYRVTLRRPTCLPLLEPKQLKQVRPERKKRHDRLLSKYQPAEAQGIYCITVDHPDHAFVCNGFVVSNTAAIWGAIDDESDTVYLYSEHYRGQAEPAVHVEAIKSRGDLFGVIDPASRGRSQKDGEQLFNIYREMGLKIKPANNGVESGIYEVYQRLSSGRLKVFSTLQNWISEYRLYRRDDKGRVVKENDHLMDACFHPNTKVITKTGNKKIKDLVGTSGYILSIDGKWQQYHDCRLTRKNAELVKVIFNDGSSVKCTPDHLFLSDNGEWIKAIDSRGMICHDAISRSINGNQLWMKSNTVAALTVQNTPIQMGTISVKADVGYIELFLKNIFTKFQKGTLYIISMATNLIMTGETWNVCRLLFINPCMAGKTSVFPRKLFLQPVNGVRLNKVKNAGEKLVLPTNTIGINIRNLSVKCVKSLLLPKKQEQIGFAPIIANQRLEEDQVLITKRGIANTVIRNLSVINTQFKNFALRIVQVLFGRIAIKQKNSLKILAVKHLKDKKDVYCLTVPKTGAFSLENGAVVHNCRYLISSALDIAGLPAAFKESLTGKTQHEYAYNPLSRQHVSLDTTNGMSQHKVNYTFNRN